LYKPDLYNFLSFYQNYIFVRVDHNARQIAAICPVIIHHSATSIFINDTRHFRLVLHLTPKQILSNLSSRLQSLSHWHHLLSKTDQLPHPWLMIKPDGVRWRPLCSFAGAMHKKFLSIFSFALMFLLRLSGIKHFALFDCFAFKDHVSDFNNRCIENDSFIFKFSFDVKNFYTEIDKQLLLIRVKFIIEFYRRTHHVNFISFPKNKSKDLLPKPCFTDNPLYFCINLDDLITMIQIALDFAYYGLGVHIILQVIGLAMGCPMSPPLAILYLAFDEHHSALPDFVRSYRPFKLHFLLDRYMDDLFLIVALTTDFASAKAIAEKVANYVQHQMYDQISGLLTLKFVEENVFLDIEIVISVSAKRIKCIYFNKNAGMSHAFSQKVGRFYSANAPIDNMTKSNAALCICVRLHDLTTYVPDMIPGIVDLSHELRLLGFSQHFVRSLFLRADLSRPCLAWKAAASIIRLSLLSS
jgi:hypothetical protein